MATLAEILVKRASHIVRGSSDGLICAFTRDHGSSEGLSSWLVRLMGKRLIAASTGLLYTESMGHE